MYFRVECTISCYKLILLFDLYNFLIYYQFSLIFFFIEIKEIHFYLVRYYYIKRKHETLVVKLALL